jgi:hypothetical protein
MPGVICPADLCMKEETRVKATAYGHSFAALVPKRMIPDHQRDDVLEVSVIREEPKVECKLYTTHLPGYKRAYLDLYQLQPRKGEEFALESVKIYDLQTFFSEYNAGKPSNLGNTSLLTEDGETIIQVDGLKMPLIRVSMRTYQGIVVVDCVIEGLGQIKFQKTVDGFEVRLGDHSPVSSIRPVSVGCCSSTGGLFTKVDRT